MDNLLTILGRNEPLFDIDIEQNSKELANKISSSNFLVIGGAGTIGSAVVKELFIRNPKVLHVVDISENNLVELVRDIRSSIGYIEGDFSTFAIDCGSDIFNAFMENYGNYDYILNFSALKHVRSEKDPYTLMRMIDTNIFNMEKIVVSANKVCGREYKYFCVSTDKAANPANIMGATKTIMELYLKRISRSIPVSSARFANVAFSDGSLLYGWNKRLEKEQPIVAPNDLRRYFVTQKEAGQLCILSCLLGENRDIFFPKLDANLNLINFSDIAKEYLKSKGYEPIQCQSEEEARRTVIELKKQKKYPVYFFKSDTTGEKEIEEFYIAGEILDMNRFHGIGIIQSGLNIDEDKIELFTKTIKSMRIKRKWTRQDIIELCNTVLYGFNHKETGKFLDDKM
jgi:FlaA1/EpsC-like NDP-sugar epimerase